MLISVGMVLPVNATSADRRVVGQGRSDNYFCATNPGGPSANLNFEAREKDGVWSGSFNITDAQTLATLSSGTFHSATVSDDTFNLNNISGESVSSGCSHGGRFAIAGTCGDEVPVVYVSKYDGGTFISDAKC